MPSIALFPGQSRFRSKSGSEDPPARQFGCRRIFGAFLHLLQIQKTAPSNGRGGFLTGQNHEEGDEAGSEEYMADTGNAGEGGVGK